MNSEHTISGLGAVPVLGAAVLSDSEEVVEATVLFAQMGDFSLLWIGLGGLLFGMLGLLLINCHRRTKAQAARDTALQEYSTRLMHSQEQERKRIAHELHDSLGQDLLLIKTTAQLAMQNSDPGVRVRLDQIASLASKAVQDVRAITGDLRPPELDRLGLASAIEAMAEKVTEHSSVNIGCGVKCVDHQLPKDSEINLYRIIQECVTNAVRHSGAERVDIRAERKNGDLSVCVVDNGRGFDAAADFNSNGRFRLGLVGLAERTRGLGGRLNIESGEGNGARIMLTIPIEEHERNTDSQRLPGG